MHRAFSLIELSIVVVVISILITLGLKSSEIVKNYEMKRILALTQEYENGFKAFYQFYNIIAGDTNKGYQLFADDNCVNSVINSTNKGCNGDNNGIINIENSTQTTDNYESILALYHLFKARLISFDNMNDLNLSNNSINNYLANCANKMVLNSEINVPALGLRNSFLSVYKLATNNLSLIISSGFDCDITNLMGVFTVEELLSLERKFDDGLPESGLIQTLANSALDSHNLCFTANDYNLSMGTLKACNLIYNFDVNEAVVNKF